jgi:hypothetical protein
MIWTPITIDELNATIQKQLPEQDSQEFRLWTMIKINPAKWAESEYGEQGGGFWAVAVLGQNVVWYNDIEEGFNVSPFSQYGTIDCYGAEQYEISHVLVQLIEHIKTVVRQRWW